MFLQLIKRSTKLTEKSLITISRPFYLCSKNLKDSSSSSSSSSSDSDSDDEKSKHKKENNKLKGIIEHHFSKRNKNEFNIAKNKENLRLENENKSFEQKLEKATKSVAEILGGDIKKTETDLLNKVKSKTPSLSFRDILREMTESENKHISRREEESSFSEELLYSQTNKQMNDGYSRTNKRQKRSSYFEKVNLYGNKSLGIFSSPLGESNTKLELWDKLNQKELNLAVTHPPANIFEEMILWTNRGILWKFPINNEQGLEEEKSVNFYDHVLLEKHLVPWCPKKGPIRHFMELVCVGLSKNPYISVKAKVDHINWFKDYFIDKKDILIDVGAVEKQELSA